MMVAVMTKCAHCGEPLTRGQKLYCDKKCHGQAKKARRTPRHGTYGEYINHGCRCEACAAVARERNRQAREARRRHSGPPPSHGRSGYEVWGCRCEVCRAAGRRTRDSKPYVRAAQAETLESAGHHYQQWTGPELELLARTDLTMKEQALMLGRTFAAVRGMRHKLYRDPRKIKLAGLPAA